MDVFGMKQAAHRARLGWEIVLPYFVPIAAKATVRGHTSFICPKCGHGKGVGKIGDGLTYIPGGDNCSLVCHACGWGKKDDGKNTGINVGQGPVSTVDVIMAQTGWDYKTALNKCGEILNFMVDWSKDAREDYQEKDARRGNMPIDWDAEISDDGEILNQPFAVSELGTAAEAGMMIQPGESPLTAAPVLGKPAAAPKIAMPRLEYSPIVAAVPLVEPSMENWNSVADFCMQLGAMFQPGEDVSWALTAADGRPGKRQTCERDELIRRACEGGSVEAAIGNYDRRYGAFLSVNPGGGTNSTVAAYRNCLIESDSMSVNAQLGALQQIGLPVVCMTYSGSKSVHAIVRVDAGSPEEFNYRVNLIHHYLGSKAFIPDPRCKDAARLSRLAGCIRGGKAQFLIGTQSGPVSFDAWADANRLRPKKSFLELAGTEEAGMSGYIVKDLAEDLRLYEIGGGIKTGFANLDKMLGGLYAGVYLVAGGTGSGKSTFSHQLADQLAMTGHDVIYFSLEQSKLEMFSKSISRLSAVTAKTDDERFTSLQVRMDANRNNVIRDLVMQYGEKVENRLTIVEGNFNLDSGNISEYVERYITVRGTVPVVFVDYIQILSAPVGKDGRQPPIRDAINQNITALNQLSARCHCPVIVISSINRSFYNEAIDFEALKESGNLEFSSHVVLGIQYQTVHDKDFRESRADRPDMIGDAKAESPRKLELKMMKSRFGTVPASCFFDYYSKFDLWREGEGSVLPCVKEDNEQARRKARERRKFAREAAAAKAAKPERPVTVQIVSPDGTLGSAHAEVIG